MMNINIIAVGKLKESYLKDGCGEYIKRLGTFCKLNIIEIQEEKCADNPTQSQIEIVKEKEGKRIIEKIPSRTHILTLCIEGRQYSSKDFSKIISDRAMDTGNMTFIIGGSFGLSDEIKTLSNTKLSFGKMTLPHQFARMILLEQIYRGFSIINNSKYHK